MTIRPILSSDTPWVKQVFQTFNLSMKDDLLGFIAEEETRNIGLITYIFNQKICQIISINSLTPGQGIGKMLLEKVEEEAKEKDCEKIITNSNETTNTFFLKNGFEKTNGFLEKTLHYS